jgi:hypothetical protein
MAALANKDAGLKGSFHGPLLADARARVHQNRRERGPLYTVLTGRSQFTRARPRPWIKPL